MGNNVRLSDVATIIMGQSPPSSTYNKSRIGLPFFQGISDFNYRYPTERIFCSSPTRVAIPGDILFSVRAPIGRVNIAQVESATGRGIAIIRAKNPNDSKYLEYFLRSIESYWDVLEGSGSVFGNATKSDLSSLYVPWPEMKEAREAIGCILGSLDDKIELNRQLCKTLEDTAQAIFKSWFVDFDPVHDKVAGKHPEGLKQEIAALFPDSFEDTALVKIPKGWKVSAVEDVINRIPVGKKYEQKTANSKGQVPILDQGQSGIIGYHDNEPGVIANRDKPIIVFANHTCYMRLIYFPFSAIQNVLPFVGNGINTIWLYYATLGKQTFIEYKGHWPDLMRQQIYVPNMSLDERYSEIVTPLLFKMWCCIEENNTLGSIRDSLLPRLISGELKVKDAEKIASRLV